jgi:hypothetical protein
MMIKKIHVYDLDGVLVDTSHRYRNLSNGSIDLNYWLANHTRENIQRDRLLPLASQYQRDCESREIYTVICTARVRHDWDVEYIASELGLPNKLIMRTPNDMTPDGAYKLRELQRIFNLRQFAKLPRYYWEDNIRNIRATFNLWTCAYLIKSNNAETA